MTTSPLPTPSDFPIVFFDGICGLCNHFVDWVLPRDHRRALRFSPLQGQTAKERLPPETLEVAESLRSVLVLDANGVHQKSAAVLRVMRYLGWPWRGFLIFALVPRPLRDAIYDYVAKNRYRWFGKKETCRLPTREERELFLD